MDAAGPLLEDLDGWVLTCLEDGLAEQEAWQKLAKVVTTSSGNSLYSVAELGHLKSSASPARVLVRQLVQRGLSLSNLLLLLQHAELHHLRSVLAPAEPAEIISQSRQGLLPVLFGGAVNIRLEVQGNPPPQLLWYKGETPLLHHTAPTFSIPHFGPQDEGVYLCLVRQKRLPQGDRLSSTGIITPALDQSSPSEEFMDLWSAPVEVFLQQTAPRMVEHPQDCRVDWGRQIVLRCSCPGAYPAPAYSWYRDGALLATSDNPSLTISAADRSSSGRYWCVARSTAGEDTSRAAVVEVRGCSDSSGMPTIVRQPILASHHPLLPTDGGGVRAATGCRGQPLQLWCSVRCSLPVRFSWVKNGSPLAGLSGPCHVLLSDTANCTVEESGSVELSEGEVQSSSLLYTPSDTDLSPLRLLCVAISPLGQVVSSEVMVELKELDLVPVVYSARRKWALLVGNRRYEGKPLHTTLPDCQRLAACLADFDYRCLVLADLTLTHFRNAVNLLASFVQQGDYVVFYYGGHGYHSAGDRLIPVDGCGGDPPDEVLAEGCLSPVWIRNRLVDRLPALLLLVLDMCRSTLPHGASPPSLLPPLPAAARSSVVLHATSVRCAALEAPSSTSVLTRHLLHRLRTHASQPLNTLAAAVLRDVSGDSSRVREQQFPVLEADLALPRTLADRPTAPDGPVVQRWEELISVGGGVSSDVFLVLNETNISSGQETKTMPRPTSTSVPRPSHEVTLSENTPETAPNDKTRAVPVECGHEDVSNAVQTETKGSTESGTLNRQIDPKYQTNKRKATETGVVVAMNALSIVAQEKSCDTSNCHLSSEILHGPDDTYFSNINGYQGSPSSLNNNDHATPETLNVPSALPVRVSVHARATMLGEDYPVANIVMVRVEVKCDSIHLPVQHRVGVIAPGCRVLAVQQSRGPVIEHRVEDLHCLTAPISVVVALFISAPLPGSTASPYQPPIRHPQKVVRLSLGRPGVSKTKLHVNNLRGNSSDEQQTWRVAPSTTLPLNIALDPVS